MDRTERQDETLKSIAVMLLRLAILAELLCVLPLPLRFLLLPLMRYSEAVARSLAAEMAGGALAMPSAAVPGPDGDSCAQALRLARCLRALALVFAGLHAGQVFRGASAGRLARYVPVLGWDQFTTARCVMALRAAGRIDTS
ncbi:hypothetical protein RB623_25240 [Mesorhizobium sp. LHD-90]|uniref:hypothetical protein n=1 Tax=Mesorhizobium sp. LHD-90 TaxID=3071414 RepID=UPI0027DFC101|nr:hypothetical protein [Mesorhizobium sp. LHD-90]MDQ6437372.1 hypothetical protein [Mesorhizobium sp. LHD-90]